MTEITRRDFLKLITIGAAGVVLNSCLPTDLESKPEDFVDKRLIKFGEEVAAWKAPDGGSMEHLIPGVGKISELLRGRVDPRKYFPFIGVPIGYDNQTNNASFTTTSVFKNSPDAAKVHVVANNINFDLPVLENGLRSKITLSQADEQTTILCRYFKGKWSKFFR